MGICSLAAQVLYNTGSVTGSNQASSGTQTYVEFVGGVFNCWRGERKKKGEFVGGVSTAGGMSKAA